MSIYSFKSHPHIPVDEIKWKEYMNYEKVDYNNKQYDDEKYQWKMVYLRGNDEKYGRMMISEKYKLIRNTTMGEFYGNSAVD